ncbi:hypothetical protein LQ564_15975 [Massilia sp. G4R7]|uniref:HTH araC/xylS-type domain-containing protein n=1 Tax=Massilia phyllostachyos TaxID=2898585 RepID=A0ABS8Q7U2_9BURK|nr:hypothetical protein [Massilia phyllostachyos]MCD2517811.1 hypothetical protein [Massilia phyllostachyos]
MAVDLVLERLVQERDAALPGWEQAGVQLTHLMFIGILRAWLADRDTLGHGLLRAANNARLAPTLRLMHGAPGRAWRLAELAQAAAMSRASFAGQGHRKTTGSSGAGTDRPGAFLDRPPCPDDRLRRRGTPVARLLARVRKSWFDNWLENSCTNKV